MRQLAPAELRRHYHRHGRKEGRAGTAAALLEAHGLQAALPDSFDPRTYLQLNVDLARKGLSAAQATVHYVMHGAEEGRRYRPFNVDVYRELYFGGEQISDASLERHYTETGRRQGRIGSAAELLEREGVPGALWADSIRLQEFALLNWSWAGKVDRFVDAARLMVKQGVTRLAPLSFDLQFDVAYFREAHPHLAHLSDERLYRHWLWEDQASSPGSPEQHLARLGLRLQRYPDAFRWRDYARQRAKLADRWAALDHLVRTGAPAHLVPPVQGGEASGFLVALARTLAFKDDPGALRLLQAAQASSALDGSGLQLIADCSYRLELWTDAYRAYVASAASGDANVWSFCNGARAALKLDRPDQALELLALSKTAYAGEPVWRAVVTEAIEAEFQQAWSIAERRYLTGNRDEADALMSHAAERSARRWAELDPLGTPLSPHPDGRVVIFANVDLSQCTHYRVSQKGALFETLGRPYAIYTQAQIEDFLTALPGASAAIFYRLIATPTNVRAIQTARNLGVPTFYDIDDLLFDGAHYPEPRATYAGSVTDEFYAMLQMGVPLFRSAMAMCDQGIASTTSLARHMERVVRSGKVHVLPNGLDHTNEIYLRHPPERGRRDEDFVIFYGSGTKAHNSDFIDLVGVGLRTVMQRHSHVRLVIVGYLELDDSFETLRDRITYIDWVPDVQSYWSILAEADLNIAVLADHVTTNAKSEIKWIEAAVLGVPSIVSATERYREVLEHDVDVLLASSPQDWTIALERMVADADLRARLTLNAREKLKQRYTLQKNIGALDALLPSLSPVADKASKSRSRVLLVNLFFPPQSYGGSTRVTRDNLDYFMANAGDDYEFAVVTTDLGGEGAYRMRVEAYDRAPVFRITPPAKPGLEWAYEDPQMRRMFSEILDVWQSDLVHFHCVQRLTASVVDVCRERGIPYINTLHDAYWISDHHFLTDDKGRPSQPDESWPLEPPPPFTIGQSLQRRRFLRPLLHDSAEILGVSESFTRLHQACGFTRARCVANGVSSPGVHVRTRSTTGRVRLAQVGSQTFFKGFHHVQAALRQERFENLELTVVDHTRYGGPVEETVWGATAVRFVGKTRQEQMSAFYAEHDVLLAPSLWPESFGLVSREALSAGLWVLASDRGAMGEDVTPGRNGWVVDVSTPQGVIAALAEINADPDRFLSSPPPPEPPLRTAQDQGRDLLVIYDRILAEPNPRPKQSPPAPSTPPARWSLSALNARSGPRASG